MSEVERYVREVLRHIEVPPREQRRIETDLRAHLEEAIHMGEPAGEAIARMGSATDVAAEFMAQIGQAYVRPWRRLVALLVPLVIIYAMGAMYFLFGWLGRQSVPAVWPKESFPFYALVFASGAISALAVLRWKRWGVYGMAATWMITLVLNILFPGPLQIGATIIAGVVVALFITGVRRLWGYLT